MVSLIGVPGLLEYPLYEMQLGYPSFAPFFFICNSETFPSFEGLGAQHQLLLSEEDAQVLPHLPTAGPVLLELLESKSKHLPVRIHDLVHAPLVERPENFTPQHEIVHFIAQQSSFLNLLLFKLQIFTGVSVQQQACEGGSAQVEAVSVETQLEGTLQLLFLKVIIFQRLKAVYTNFLVEESLRKLSLSFLSLQNE